LVRPVKLPTPKENRASIEHLTGRILLLLHPLFQYKHKPFHESEFLLSDELTAVKDNINGLYNLNFTLTDARRDWFAGTCVLSVMQTPRDYGGMPFGNETYRY
jgi:hypothetical protein